MLKKRNAPITDMFQEYGVFGDFVLTKQGTLICALELEGREPDGLTPSDFSGLTAIARNIYQGLPSDITISQYYMHYSGEKIFFKERENNTSNLLSKRRQAYLNSSTILSSKIIHALEIKPIDACSKLNYLDVIKHISVAAFDATSREALRYHFMEKHSLAFYLKELLRQESELKSAIIEIKNKWSGMFDCRTLTLNQLWGFARVLANVDPSCFFDNAKAPSEKWDTFLSSGDRELVSVNGMDVVKVYDTPNKYVRVLAITGFGETSVAPGMFAAGDKSPIEQRYNYIIMTRFSPLSDIEKKLLFWSKETELKRKNLKLGDLLKGATNSDSKASEMKEPIRKRLKELGEAEAINDHWGTGHSFVAIFERDPHKLEEACVAIKKSLSRSGFLSCWESAGVFDAFKTMQMAGKKSSLRSVPLTTSQYGALSLIYRGGEGQKTVKDLQGEEAQYVFLGDDGKPFYFNPFVCGRGFVFGIGPIRSGKTFLKNTVASHFLKYGGIYRALDIDAGTETLAKIFEDDGAIINFSDEGCSGFNPFAMCKGPDDNGFIAHFKGLLKLMLACNESELLRVISPNEQTELDAALRQVLRLPKEMQTLSTFVSHFASEGETNMKFKLSRWIGKGEYAKLFNQSVDPMGNMEKKVAVFNLKEICHNKTILPLVMKEIFYRIICAFEDESLGTMPKWLDIDEAHELFAIPGVTEEVVRKIRTWGKRFAGIGMWSQSPEDFSKLKNWDVLLSSASTLFFMADPTMKDETYINAFNLTPGECDAIKNLVPKREAYIIQRDIGVSKKLVLQVEPEQYVMVTSSATEIALRQKNIDALGFKRGIEKTIGDLKLECKKHEVA